jgi:hypothetical protein
MKQPAPSNHERLALVKALAKAIATDAQDIASDSPTYPQAHQSMGEDIIDRALEIVALADTLKRLDCDPSVVVVYYEALRKVSACYNDIEGFLDVIDDPHPSVTRRRKAMDKALDAAFALFHPKK